MNRLAAIDCGTNSIRMLISDVTDGKSKEIRRTMQIVRLGEGVDEQHAFSEAALARTRATLEQYVKTMEIECVHNLRMVATSATRDVENREKFFDICAELLGRINPNAQVEVISGEEEAALSFTGAVADANPADGPYCVVDLGGGSTEFVVGDHDGTILGSHSARMGCVRLTERIMHSNPASVAEIALARDYVDEQLLEMYKHVPITSAHTMVGCAGTFTTLSALAQGLESYDPYAIHGSVLRFDALRVLTQYVIGETAEQLAAHPVIHPGRADIIGGGAMVVQGIIDFMQRETSLDSIMISEKDILDGIIAGLMEAQ